jgi:hypothetical protein
MSMTLTLSRPLAPRDRTPSGIRGQRQHVAAVRAVWARRKVVRLIEGNLRAASAEMETVTGEGPQGGRRASLTSASCCARLCRFRHSALPERARFGVAIVIAAGTVPSHSTVMRKICLVMGIDRVLVRRVAVALLPALALSVAACSSSTSSGASASATESATASASASPATASDPVRGAATPQAAVTDYVRDILEQHYFKACVLNVPPAGVNIAAACKGSTPIRVLQALHGAWAKPGITLPPQSVVQVTGVTVTGDTASVNGSDILVDNHNLNQLMLIGSTANAAGSTFGLTLQEQGGRWFIGNEVVNLGNSSSPGTSTAS